MALYQGVLVYAPAPVPYNLLITDSRDCIVDLNRRREMARCRGDARSDPDPWRVLKHLKYFWNLPKSQLTIVVCTQLPKSGTALNRTWSCRGAF